MKMFGQQSGRIRQLYRENEAMIRELSSALEWIEMENARLNGDSYTDSDRILSKIYPREEQRFIPCTRAVEKLLLIRTRITMSHLNAIYIFHSWWRSFIHMRNSYAISVNILYSCIQYKYLIIYLRNLIFVRDDKN